MKKTPPPKKSTKELEAERKMLRCVVEPKKPMPSDYKCTMQNLHCAKRSDEILQNQDEQCSNSAKKQGYQSNNNMVNQIFKWHMHPRLEK
jgi:hypothetical protein